MKDLKKELLHFVKLQKWEDRGYYSLKKSGERAQRKLHKLCRDAEEVLKAPVASVLAQISLSVGFNALHLIQLSSTLEEISPGPLSEADCPLAFVEMQKRALELKWNGMSMPRVLKMDSKESRFSQLPRLSKRMRELANESPPCASVKGMSSALEDTCDAILSRIAELQKDSSKAARGRKKKALSDFMNLLNDMDISKRKSDIPKGTCISSLSLFHMGMF